MGEATQEESTVVSSNWRDTIPDNVKEWDEFKNSDSADKFFDQMSNMRSMIGNSIRVPSEEASDEARSDFYEKVMRKAPDLMRRPDIDNDEVMTDVWGSLGKPETPAKYDLPEFEDYQINDNRAQELKEMAHKANLTKRQFKALANDILGLDRQSQMSVDETVASDKKTLASDWGEAYEQRTRVAATIAEKSGAPEALVNAIKEGKADSGTMKWLYQLSKQMSGEGSPMASMGDQIDSPADIQGKVDDIMNNQSHPYWDSAHPQHKRAVDNMVAMRRKLA